MIAIINDGYNEPGYLAERKGLHPAVKFTFRPMLHEKRAGVNALIMAGGVNGPRAMVKAIVDHLVSWDVCDKDKKPVEVSLANVAHLRPNLIEGLYNIVSGWAPSDPEPNATPEEAGADTAISQEAWLKEQTVADVKASADAKN